MQCIGTEKLQNAEDDSVLPPYVLKEVPAKREQATLPSITTSKRKKREAQEIQEENQSQYQVSSYKLPNAGPYPVDALRKNKLRYTPAQGKSFINFFFVHRLTSY